MADGSFRKINVDLLLAGQDQGAGGSDGALLVSDLEGAPDPRGASAVQAAASDKEALARGALQRGDAAQALKAVLDQPAYGPGVDDAKAMTLHALVLVLNSTKSTDIGPVVAQLGASERVRLMQYLYKAMALTAQGKGEQLGVGANVTLAWHEKLTEMAGIGCINRAMTDRRRV